MNKRGIFSFLIAVSAFFSARAEMGVPIQLKLKSPGGVYPSEAGVSFRVLVLSAGTSCVLREEVFSGQTVNNGNISLSLGSGTRGSLDPNLSLNQVYDNSKSKTGLSCVDANSNVVATGQTYAPTSVDQRVIRVMTTLSSENILVNFNMRATPYAIQAESVGGKVAADIIVNNTSTQMNQTNLNDLLQDATRFTNLKNIAVSGQAATAGSAASFTGSLAGDVSGTQSSTSVDKIKGVAVSGTAPATGQVLQFNGTQYVPVSIATSAVTSVAGRTGAVVLTSSDISGLGSGAGLNAGTSAGNLVQLDGTGKIPSGVLPGSTASGDVSGPLSALVVNSVGGKTSAQVAGSVADVNAATAANTSSTLVKRDAGGNVAVGSLSATNASTQNVYIYDVTNTNSVRLKAPASFSSYILTLPTGTGSAGQILQTDGSGNLSWVNASTGSVTSVSAVAPLLSSGGATPSISLPQASVTASGYLSSSDFSSFSNKQNALGYVPLNSASNLSDLGSASAARGNLGLGGAAVLSVGTSAGTVAAGDDARISGALPSAAFNAYVAPASCTSSETLYWNSVSSTFSCQAINFPASAVTSVAGRTGAVLLSSSDISGLGGAAALNVGTSAGTVAAGNDSRLTGAFQSSSSLSGDVTGTPAAVSVNKIKGVAVSATAPTSGQVLQYNGSQYVPSTLPSAPVTTVAGRTGAIVLTSSDISGLGAAAALNVGTSAGTVAAGNDARFTDARTPTGAASGDLTGTYPNPVLVNVVTAGTSSKVTFDAKGRIVGAAALNSADITSALGFTPLGSAPVISVAGRTGAIVLTSSDISGLGGAAALNVGTSAGTVAAGNDSRIVGAFQASSSLSGDVTGTPSAVSVNKIKGVAVSATAPTSGQVLQYNGTQYVPTTPASAPVSSVAGRTGAVVLSSSDISGLGGAAVLNVGTSAGTVAAGNDSRFTDSRTPTGAASGDLSGTYPNPVLANVVTAGTSSKVTFDAKGRIIGSSALTSADITVALGFAPIGSAPVTSVAGRTGAVVLSSSDISGLGAAAGMAVGTSAGTVAAGNDSRIVGAFQASSSLSGDVTGTPAAVSVNKIKGVAVSATAPVTGQVLQYDGSQYVPVAIPSAPVSSVAGRTGAVVLTSADISGLNVGTTAGTLAAGNDSRFSDSRTPTGSAGGDLAGTYPNPVLANVVTAGTSSKVTFDAKGRIISSASLNSADITSALGFSLGGSASLNVGTSAGTVAAGNDSRITGALQASSFNGYVAAAGCTSSETLYWNSVSSTFSCQAINFPASAVTSVAGRTGAVVLSSSDISGLGDASALNVGTSAGTVAAGNDSRIVGAFQASSSLSGDVTGTPAAVSVNKIKGVAVSATAPTSGQVLQYNGTQYVPTTPASAPVSSVAGRTGAVVLSSSDISGLNVGTTAGTLAAGNDSRFSDSRTPTGSAGGDLAGTYPNPVLANVVTAGTSSKVTFDAKGRIVSSASLNSADITSALGFTPISSAPVSSVAGRTGAVVLTSSDISGLGGAAALNVGTSAGTVAAGNDSRIVNALSTSSVLSGDVSGTSSTVSVNKIKGVAVSATAPTSGQVLQYNGSQYVPTTPASAPVSSVAGRTGAVVLSSSDISGLGGAAVLNVGTSAGTVAAGNDSRITGALQAATFNGYVAAAGCTSSETLYWNSVSSTFSCQAINFPASAVTSVAGRTGAVVLSSSDISGLGGAAVLNVGTSAGTVAAGNDSRILGAFQASSSLSGDVTGTPAAVSVNKIKGVAVSATAPTSGQVLQYNGTQYVPTTPASAPVTTVAGRTGAIVLTSSDISGLGAAAALNVGTSAGTVAAGNDSRFTDSRTPTGSAGGDLAGTYPNPVLANVVTAGTSSKVTFDAKGRIVSSASLNSADITSALGFTPISSAPVSSVAGRTGAVVLVSSDISGLGAAAGMAVGTTAGTVAAGNDTRIVNAFQTSSSLSGDVTGTPSAVSVNKIKGIAVSATSPTNGQVLQYNGSQYSPVTLPSAPVSSVAGRTGAVVLTNADISGLGGAALLNVGTASGTVAAGDDPRIVGALQSSALAVAVGSANCTATQSMYWNSVSSQFLCQNITTGTTAGTLAAGNDTRIVNAVQTSTALSGDVSGTVSTVSVDKIKGRAVASSSPAVGQALVWDGTQWVPTTGLPRYAKVTATQTFSSNALANVTNLSFTVAAGVTYKFKFNILYTSASTNTGLRLGLTYPAVTAASAMANIPSAADGTGAYFQGVINNSGDSVVAPNTPVAASVVFAQLEGTILPTAAGTVQLRAASEVNGSNIVIYPGSVLEINELP